MEKALIAAMVSLVAFAGCISDANEPIDSETLAEFANPIVHDHDHDDPFLHDISNNMELVGYHPIREGDINTISEMDLAGGHAFVAEMGYGFHIFDVSEPTEPF